MIGSKDLKDWTFDELVQHCAWKFVEDLLAGVKLHRAMYAICELAARWQSKYHGQRNLAFDAKQWAECGWKGHELHAGEVIDIPLLEDNSDILPSREVVQEMLDHLDAPPENKEKK